MKKNIIYFILVICILNLFGGCALIEDSSNSELKELSYEDIADKLIRFHVIANSDSDEDQALKLKVRDKIIEKMAVKLENIENLDEARDILVSSVDEVTNIAKEVIVEEGYNYDVNTMLSNENFPDKIYGDYIFPQGNYEAYRVIIGDGMGQNWWCVMFPPLCFVDESKNTVDSSKLEDSIKSIESEDEHNNENNKVIYKFKIIEVFNKIFNK